MITSLQEICSGCQSVTAVTDTGPVEFSLQVKTIRPQPPNLEFKCISNVDQPATPLPVTGCATPFILLEDP